MTMMNRRIIAAHAGTGKTTLAKMHPERHVDFVAMPYKYYLSNGDIEDAEHRKADFSLEMQKEWPQNYIDAILHELEQHDKILLIPSTGNVLQSLAAAGIAYFLCYPRRELKEEYCKRYELRGNSEDFLFVFIDGWDGFMDSLEADRHGEHIVLEEDAYLSDVFCEKGLYADNIKA